MLALVSLSNNLIERFGFSEPPNVKSSGVRAVIKDSFKPSKSTGGARDPE